MRKIRLGKIHADYLTMAEAIDEILELTERKKGGFIVTPNVDHVVLAEKNAELRDAYADASLSLVDGMPLVWASKFAGFPLPEKVSGSDIVRPLLRRAAERGLKVYLLGAAPNVGATAAQRLVEEMPTLQIVGVDSPPMGFEKDPAIEREILARIALAKPDLVLLALGCPKQEVLMHRWHKLGMASVMLGVGATFDFIAGKVKRAPRWMSSLGLEWLYRLSQDPRRLAKRYLIQDAQFFGIFLGMMRQEKTSRVYCAK
jgi:N-acetylglucosaminyldiphosphoundecaprenol N-acetyl-beta-D-mannosaminyltransferase